MTAKRRDAIRFFCTAVGLALLAGCGSKTEDCNRVRELFRGEVAWGAAPRQADMSPEGQAANWRWRAERARERAAAARGLAVETEALRPFLDELGGYYDGLAREADAAGEAWEAGDNEAMQRHVQAFDGARNEPWDALDAQLETACR